MVTFSDQFVLTNSFVWEFLVGIGTTYQISVVVKTSTDTEYWVNTRLTLKKEKVWAQFSLGSFLYLSDCLAWKAWVQVKSYHMINSVRPSCQQLASVCLEWRGRDWSEISVCIWGSAVSCRRCSSSWPELVLPHCRSGGRLLGCLWKEHAIDTLAVFHLCAQRVMCALHSHKSSLLLYHHTFTTHDYHTF